MLDLGPLVQGNVPQSGDFREAVLDLLHRRGAFLHPFPISRSGQRVLHHRVHRDESDAVRQVNGAVLQAAAVDRDRRMLAPEDRHVLVHDAAWHPNEFPLGALAEPGQFQGCERPSVQAGERGGHLEGSGRTQSRALRNRAANQQVGRFNRESGMQQLLGHADRIIDPATRMGETRQLRHVPFAHFAEVFRVNPQLAVGIGRRTYIGSEIQGDRADETQVVVGMFADQVDPAGGPVDANPSSAVPLAELLDHEELRLPRHAMKQHKNAECQHHQAAV